MDRIQSGSIIGASHFIFQAFRLVLEPIFRELPTSGVCEQGLHPTDTMLLLSDWLHWPPYFHRHLYRTGGGETKSGQLCNYLLLISYLGPERNILSKTMTRHTLISAQELALGLLPSSSSATARIVASRLQFLNSALVLALICQLVCFQFASLLIVPSALKAIYQLSENSMKDKDLGQKPVGIFHLFVRTGHGKAWGPLDCGSGVPPFT